MQHTLPVTAQTLPTYKSSVADYSMIRDWRNALKTPPTYHRIGNRTFRFNYHFVFLILCVITLIIFIYGLRSATSPASTNSIIKNNDSTRSVSNMVTSTYNYTYPLSAPTISNGMQTYRIALIADLDKKSKDDKRKYSWRSYFKKGYLSYSETKNSVAVSFDTDSAGGVTEYDSGYSLNGRGMELSELVTFNGRLLTFDDRTGIVYEISGDKLIPWVLLMDGDGKSSKGFKSEWATVKDEVLYVGSMGKEWTSSSGEFESYDPMYVKAVTTTGEVNIKHRHTLAVSEPI